MGVVSGEVAGEVGSPGFAVSGVVFLDVGESESELGFVGVSSVGEGSGDDAGDG